MTQPVHIVALFCADIREEKSGSLTLVGIFGDNVSIPRPPKDHPDATGIVPKLAVYVRIGFDVTAVPKEIALQVIMPNGEELPRQVIEEKTIVEAGNTKDKGNPLGSVIARLEFVPFPISKLGLMIVNAIVDGETFLAGTLNFMLEG
jgi:hypothetical protein